MELTSNNNCNSIYGTYTRSCKYGILIEYVRLQETRGASSCNLVPIFLTITLEVHPLPLHPPTHHMHTRQI